MSEIEKAITRDITNCKNEQLVKNCHECSEFMDMHGKPCPWSIAKTFDDVMNLCRCECPADHCDECAFLKFTKPLRYIRIAIEDAEAANYWAEIPCDPDEVIKMMGIEPPRP
jgi:hypothetical protein